MDKTDKLDPQIEAVFKRILASAGATGATKLEAWKQPEREIRHLAKRDYVRALRRNLVYRELKAVLSALDKVFAPLDDGRYAWGSLEGMRVAAETCSLHFKAEPYGGDEGLPLRGFYADKGARTLRHPLIFINTAHAPIAIAATFCHELAHYLTAEVLRNERQSVHLFHDSAYASHLGDPVELIADSLVALRAYPREFALKLFKTAWNWGLVGRIGSLPANSFEQIRVQLKQASGFDFPAELPALQNIHYLCGMIHYAKLRWALLVEYDL